MDKVLVITGPTASGKTAIAVRLAQILDGEVINADSMQIYKKCDIGSAKPSDIEKKGIRHHMMDIIEPDQTFSTAQYKEAAVACVRDVLKRGKVPVIAGGTGLYIDALVKNIDFSNVGGSSEVRERLNVILKKEGAGAVYDLLKARDPEAAETVHPNNSRRVIRYLEILEGYDKPLAEYMESAVSSPPEFDYNIFVLWPEREFVYESIEKRVDIMLDAGLVNEVQSLIESGITENDQCMMGIGYKETYSYISGAINKKTYIEILKRNTRRYAKRQFTWLKRYKEACFINVGKESTVENLVSGILEELGRLEDNPAKNSGMTDLRNP
jgi:tRNA dimethylallyltransferase